MSTSAKEWSSICSTCSAILAEVSKEAAAAREKVVDIWTTMRGARGLEDACSKNLDEATAEHVSAIARDYIDRLAKEATYHIAEVRRLTKDEAAANATLRAALTAYVRALDDDLRAQRSAQETAP